MPKMFSWAFLFLCVLAAAVAGQFVNTESIQWKYIELAALGTGSIGVVAVIGDAHKVLPKNTIDYERKRTRSWLRTLGFVCSTNANICEMRITQMGATSPPQDSTEYADAKSWFQEGEGFFVDSERGSLPSLKDWIGRAPNAVERELKTFVSEVAGIVDDYEASLMAFNRLESRMESTPLEHLAVIISPYLISVAIGLSAFKVVYS